MEELIKLIQQATIPEIAKWVAFIGAALSVFIEITPIKVNPISHLLKWIGKVVNGEVIEEVNTLKKEMKQTQYDNAKRAAVECRVRILRFGDELRQNQKHSSESFVQVLEDIDSYEDYCIKHPEFKNNKTHLTTKKILEEYTHCMDNNDFL